MWQDTVKRLEEGFEHFAHTGEPMWDQIHEDVEIHDHDIMDASEYRGHAGFRRWLEDWTAAWSDFTMEPEEFIDAGNRAIIVLRMKATGRGSGVPVDRQDAIVWELRGEKFGRIDYYNSREQALRAAGLLQEETEAPEGSS
jgi:ketosteroid isomerase-like protein